MKPKISVILTTYNRPDFLKKAIESVVNQSFTEWELIIVDDHSTDNTPQVVEKYLTDKRIRYHRRKENFGTDTRPKNDGAKLSRADYIAYLDDDVKYRKHALRTLYNKRGDYDVVYGDMWIEPHGEPGIARDFDRMFLMYRNFIDTSSALMKREALFDVGGWSEEQNKFVDWNLWVRMAKAGKKFKRVPKITFDYYIHEGSKSNKVQTPMYDHPEFGRIYVPTFDPFGCEIHAGELGKRKDPKVAIFTIHYNRPDYSKQTYKEMRETAEYPFDWYCYNNGGTPEFGDAKWLGDGKNVGITEASNKLLDKITGYDLIIKVDNDVEFLTYGWLKDMIDVWHRNHMVYLSPYVEGLYHNPGGAPRISYGFIGDDYVEITNHIGGICAMISAEAYREFRFEDTELHGNQDVEASHYFRNKGYVPMYFPKHIICHRDTTWGQWQNKKDYFKERNESISNGS